jgi:hypothetical protein
MTLRLQLPRNAQPKEQRRHERVEFLVCCEVRRADGVRFGLQHVKVGGDAARQSQTA